MAGLDWGSGPAARPWVKQRRFAMNERFSRRPRFRQSSRSPGSLSGGDLGNGFSIAPRPSPPSNRRDGWLRAAHGAERFQRSDPIRSGFIRRREAPARAALSALDEPSVADRLTLFRRRERARRPARLDVVEELARALLPGEAQGMLARRFGPPGASFEALASQEHLRTRGWLGVTGGQIKGNRGEFPGKGEESRS